MYTYKKQIDMNIAKKNACINQGINLNFGYLIIKVI